MSRIPNPFLSGQGQQQQSTQSTSTPGFLVMTRPATGSNSYGGRDYRSPYHTPSRPSDSFIPLSASGSKISNEDANRRGGSRNSIGRYIRSGARNFPNQGSPRFIHPYQQTPGRMSTPFGQNQGFSNSPRGRLNIAPVGGRFADRQDRSFGEQNMFNHTPNSRRGRNRGPLAFVPIDKFVSLSMVKDPWAEFDVTADADTTSNPNSSPVVVTLGDSDAELIIDSDVSVVIENSYEEGISGTEGDSSPVHDTGSDSPYLVTSSTSEKDTGSDSTSDT
ncbi:uncharacterized protein [Panulirus ornatus]|uniref:uncharacterized protein n=1 Tax=Panulirus ornatus TaxID=150431 RepID=UPI003A84D6A1